MLGSRVRRVADMGFPQVGYQAFKLLAHQRLHEAVSHWREKYPGVDIILIEPDPNDELMFETNILNFTRRVEIARHGFESVTLKLAARTTTSSRPSAPSTASRSRPRACARSCAASPRSASAPPPGAASSSRPPARCCGSPKRPRPPSGFRQALQQPLGGGRVADARAHVVIGAERAARGHDHALLAQPGGQLRSRHARRRQPDEVGLAVVDVHRRARAGPSSSRPRSRITVVAPALDLRPADLQRLARPRPA